MLSELAIDNKEAFAELVSIAKDSLDGKKYTPKVVEKAEKKEEVKEEKTEEKKLRWTDRAQRKNVIKEGCRKTDSQRRSRA